MGHKKNLIKLVILLLLTIIFPFNVASEKYSLKDIQNTLHNLSSKNILETYDNDKYNSLLNKAKDYAITLLNKGEILSYELSSSSVIFNHTSGLTIVFSPIIKNTYSGETVVSNNSIDIYTIQSWYDSDALVPTPYTLPSGVDNDAELIPAVANNIASLSFCNYDDTHAIKNIDLPFTSLDSFSLDSFGANQIIIWQGHGCWGGSEIHSVLWTKRPFDSDAYEAGGQYKEDCDAKRIVMVNGYDEAITSKYIDEYCSNLSNSLIYLGQCEGGYDPVLAHSFLDKGASAVVANSKTIQAAYGDIMQYTTLDLLTKTNSDTGKLYTLGQALNKAKQIYGVNDKALNPYAYGAEPLLFGNENYSLSELTIPQNLYYEESSTENRNITSINEGFNFVLPGTSESLKTNTPGVYEVEAKLNEGYKWSDGSFENKPVTLTISKAYTKFDSFVAPIENKELRYTGNNLPLVSTGTPLDKIHYGFNDPDSDDPIVYSLKVPTSLYAGTYEVVWYADGKNENYLSYGSISNPISYFIDVDFGQRENIFCIMPDAYLGYDFPNPTLSDVEILSDEDSNVTFYFNTQNKYNGSINWNSVDKSTLDLGTYYMYASIKDKHGVYRYDYYDTPIVEFNVIKKPHHHSEYVAPKTAIN